jgi:hypothetical protein
MKNLIILTLLLTGCASTSGVIADGKDSFIIIVSGGHRFTSASDLKIDAYKEANTYCKKHDAQIETISERSIQAGVLTNSSEAELKFKCIANQNN